MDSFYYSRFESRVSKALKSVERILSITRHPSLPSSVSHEYVDKYHLAEFVTNTALASLSTIFEKGFRLGDSALKSLIIRQSKTQSSASIQFIATEQCDFIKEATRNVESANTYVTETNSSLFGNSKRTEKVITKITEYFWNFQLKWDINVLDASGSVTRLCGGSGVCEMITTTKDSPRPKFVNRPPIELTLNWYLSQLNADLQSIFSIDRSKSSCRTPRRNDNIEAAFRFLRLLFAFSEQIIQYFQTSIFPTQANHAIDINAINRAAEQVFNPVLPLFEKNNNTNNNNINNNNNNNNNNSNQEEKKTDGLAVTLNGSHWPLSPCLSVGDINLFLVEQSKSLSDQLSSLSKVFPSGPSAKLIQLDQASLLLCCHQMKAVCQSHLDSIDFIEDLLRKQLIAAIGKELTTADFNNYIKYHMRKIYKNNVAPSPFAFAVRRPGLFPEGFIAIESSANDNNAGIPEPVYGLHRSLSSFPMYLSLNASTRLQFHGERHLHALLLNQFSGDNGTSLSLVARARQFSCYMLLVGKLISATEFQPKGAIILQNKDDWKIPLLCETIPSAKEFRDAIESLSPEQQRFAKAYRSMQLESSIFGLLIIQIKPALEKVLNLPPLALVKEIQLTQDLLQLFIKYQIPPDQLSFDPLTDINLSSTSSLIDEQKIDANTKIDAVKKHVKDILAMINQAKNTQMQEIQQQADYAIESRAMTEDLFGGSPIAYASAMSMPMAVPCPPPSMSLSFAAPPSAPMMAPPPPPMKARSAPRPAPAPGGVFGGAPVPIPKPIASPIIQPTITTTAAANTQPVDPSEASSGVDDDQQNLPMDFTKVPSLLDRRLDSFDEEGSVRPTILNPGATWSKTSNASLLSDSTTVSVGSDDQSSEKNRSMDLLDALSRSGALSLDDCSLHVILAATHCFDKSLINTVIQDNINPIEKLERSSLIIATSIQQQSVHALVKAEALPAIEKYAAQKLIQEEQKLLQQK